MDDDTKTATATGAATGISALAAFIGLCCVGPWAVAVFGVSGAVVMARWQPAQPYLLALAGSALAWAFWRVYGPRDRAACENDVCVAKPSFWLKTSLWLAAVLVVLAFFADQLQWLFIDPTPKQLR